VVSALSSSVALTLLGTMAGSGNNLAQALVGGSTRAASGDPVLALRLAEKNRDRDIARTGKEPQTLRDIAAFSKALGKAKSIEQALDDPAVMKVLLTANGLADQLAYPALSKKVLLSDPADTDSLVNRMGSNRWTAVVKAFDFAKNGLAALTDPAVVATLTDGYTEVAWRKGLEKQTPGLADALDFRERASSFKSAIEILADPVMRRVVTTTLGIPQQIAFQDIDAQERAIGARLDVSRLQDSRFVDGFSQRYLLEARKSASASITPDLTTLAAQMRSLVV
jgi:hypothetical protein